ncbi:type I-E CRISPR-associated protein Cas6/Cse3/CasE [Actinobacteria bacterium YIM 96077]|uniref:Type I-E CRISPR-associated protein Cas6/Cse3/CasE n=1 Tax=Phytoactinopolyspora halophila TaxID=1981511 RepID=A0A329QAU0_9ACTN|nr:type I-E CRISPR-associated protein Cas6/Cse3/CasE [Actinobacteria bacterium YIM 96077]RAW09456.1 type I-E CRISPR-associated protein Cas6/Cse3/CasE [Phytoactinopolyspora halophila]
MYLSRLIPDTTAHAFRRDYADIHQMHRTIMSGFPELPEGSATREQHGVLWRLDHGNVGYTLYVQSRTQPNWDGFDQYLKRPADVRELSTTFDTLKSGRVLSFRLIANPTRRRKPEPGEKRRADTRYSLKDPEEQISWLVNRGTQNGFTIPTGADARPDLAPSPCPRLTGYQGNGRHNKVTVDPVRFDGHLVITDPSAFVEALCAGIGPAKSYGCGLVTLAPPHRSW